MGQIRECINMKVDEVFTYYLPQYHEIEENNEWWGKGFTEWTNVKNAKPLFKGHLIHKPSQELGFYCLDDIEVIESQYQTAKKHGITSFCFWHYWFGDNQTILEKPVERLLQSNKNVKFCLAWANHSWFNKTKGLLLKEQTYTFDLDLYFSYLLPFFKDTRYTRINNKPVFVIYDPASCKNLSELIELFQKRAREHGFPGICFIAENTRHNHSHATNFDYYLDSRSLLRNRGILRKMYDRIIYRMGDVGLRIPRKYSYIDIVSKINSHVFSSEKCIPIVLPRWDSTIRHGKGGYYLEGSDPSSFEAHVKSVHDTIKRRGSIRRLVFIKSWNEWAEGNFIEPCDIYSDLYLKIFSKYFG